MAGLGLCLLYPIRQFLAPSRDMHDGADGRARDVSPTPSARQDGRQKAQSVATPENGGR